MQSFVLTVRGRGKANYFYQIESNLALFDAQIVDIGQYFRG